MILVLGLGLIALFYMVGGRVRVDLRGGNMSWTRFMILVLIAFGGFAYGGPAQPLVRALATVVIAASAAEGVLGRRGAPTHTELVVETHPRLLLESYGTLRDILLERWNKQGRTTEQWRFIFFGPPGTGDTIVWSARHKAMFSGRRLISEELWQEILKGEADSEREPRLVFDLARDLERRHSVYRMYLEPNVRNAKPTVLAQFPVALLKDLKSEKGRLEVARMFDLRAVEQEADIIEDAFGEPYTYYPYHVYENDLFKFKVLHYWNRE